MKNKTDYTNPKRILSYNEAAIITQKEYSIIKELSISINKIIKLNNTQEIDYKNNLTKLLETPKYQFIYNDPSKLKQEILIANILLPNDIKIIDILTENGFTLNHLKAIIRYRSIIKELLINNYQLDEELKKDIFIYKKITSKIINIFKQNFNFDNSTIILNRICELIITCPHLFEEKSYSKKLIK